MRRVLAAVVAVIVVVAPTTACSGRKKPAPPAAQVSAQVKAGAATTLSVADVQVVLPDGAAKDGVVAKLAVGGEAPAAPDGMTVAGPAVAVDLPGGLTQPATVTFQAPAAVKDGTLTPVVVWQDAAGDWRWVPTTYTAGESGISATVDHFSGGFLGGLDIKKWIKDRGEDFKNYITGRSGVAQPRCGDEKAARPAGVEVTSDGGDRVKWCFGVDNGRRVVRIANNSRTFMQIAYPSAWKVVDGQSHGFSTDSAARALGMLAVTPKGTASRIVDGGDTLTLEVPENSTGRVTAEMSILAWAISAIVFGIQVYYAVVKAASDTLAKAAKGTIDRLFLLLGGTANAEPIDGLIECTKAVSDLTEMNETNALDVTKAVWGCLPGIMKAQLKDVKVFAAGVLLNMVGTAVGLILTGINLLVTGLRELWDQFAGFGGKSDPVYDVVIRLKAATVADADLRANNCPGCRVKGQFAFLHPTWGVVTLVVALSPTGGAGGYGSSDLIAFDAQRKVVWRKDYDRQWESVAFADPGMDATGNVFINFNPGRLNGVIILRPVAGGLKDFATLPDAESGYQERFYSARLVMDTAKGTYTVRSELNDCEPSCAEGTIHTTTYRYNGTDYVKQ
ncbi:hypothetical protein [Dactylosporangium maewongense]|uniref:hypothetical protein n=1 Tax=Dactylosporangium maewongense TaxID=634393 RepID=UPI0031DD5889